MIYNRKENPFRALTTKYQYWISALFLLTVVFYLLSCRKLTEARPPVTSLSQLNVYKSDVSAISVLTGLYQQVSQETFFSGSSSISLITGFGADEFTLSSAVSNTDPKYFHYVDSLVSNINVTRGLNYWGKFYNYIFVCNAAIEGLSTSTTLSTSVKQQLLGEAKFMRAFCYFYLVNLYGDVPLALSTFWEANSRLSRSSKQLVYEQIIKDLQNAQELLSSDYLDANLQVYSVNQLEKVRPSKWAAIALLARVYLYTEQWSNAEMTATLVINHTFGLPLLTNAFLKNSQEAIWQLQPILSGRNTRDAELFLLPVTGPNSNFPAYLSPYLLAAFEGGDQRRYNRNWVDSVKVGSTTYYFPYKYKAGINSGITTIGQLSEYVMVLRLAEQYLIRAEARSRLDNLSGGVSDLNVIRSRAFISNGNYSGIIEKNAILTAILHERQVEFFSEWGHRWFDLKRTGKIDSIMTIVRPTKANGAPWESYMQLFPVPFSDIQANNNLQQNPGYN